MQRIKRLVSQSSKPTPLAPWCTFGRAAKRQLSGRVVKPASRDRFIPAKSSRSLYRKPVFGRAVSKDFFDLLKRCVDNDKDLRFVRGEIDSHHKKYASLLSTVSARAGKAERLRLSTSLGNVVTTAKSDIGDAEVDKRLAARLKTLNKAKAILPNVIRRRNTSFRKLYSVAQTQLERVPTAIDESDRILPDEFFSQMQEILDSYRVDQVQNASKVALCRQVMDKRKQLRVLESGAQSASERRSAIRNEREELSKNYSVARFESSVREESMMKRERELVNILWPYVASEADMFGRISPNASEVSRGDKHEPMDEELPPAFNSIPSDRDDLIKARDMASELLRAKIARHDRLAWRYFLDIESYLQEDPSHTRLVFDHQFLQDRTQAMKEVTIAEIHLKHFNDRLKNEGRRRLQDYTSDFGDITDDGRASSMRTDMMREVRRRRELDRSYIEEYISNIDTDNLRNPWSPISPRNHDDFDWDARSIDLGDIDTFSKAEDPRTRDRIRGWREKMEEIRREMPDERRTVDDVGRGVMQRWCITM